jgi:hypothetical protein
MKYFLSLEKGYATARHYIIGILKKGLCDGHCNFTIPMPESHILSQFSHNDSVQVMKVY